MPLTGIIHFFSWRTTIVITASHKDWSNPKKNHSFIIGSFSRAQLKVKFLVLIKRWFHIGKYVKGYHCLSLFCFYSHIWWSGEFGCVSLLIVRNLESLDANRERLRCSSREVKSWVAVLYVEAASKWSACIVSDRKYRLRRIPSEFNRAWTA